MLQVVSMLSSNRKYRTTILSHNITLTSHNENKDEHTHRCIEATVRIISPSHAHIVMANP